MKSNTNWHILNKDSILEKLHTSYEGISETEATERLEKYGKNELEEEKKKHWVFQLLEQFKSILIVVLIIAAVISLSIGEGLEAIAIIIIVILAGVLGFVQEFHAGKAIDSLRKMAAPHSNVVRDGKDSQIPARELVPGDVIILKTGDKIPADCRILESNNLKTDEAPLTGESTPIDKISDQLKDEKASIGDRINMVYSGTAVSFGRGKAVVVGTGMNTEFGKIAQMLHDTEGRKTPLQNNLDDLGKRLGVFAIIIATLMGLFGIYKGYELLEMFIWGVALAVAVIPEALPAVVTISLALGVKRMIKRKALIRKLPAVETLGSTNIICSDKTGTLTKDEMTVRKIFAAGTEYTVSGSGYSPDGKITSEKDSPYLPEDSALNKLLVMGSLCNDSKLTKKDDKWKVLGDPTEGALIVAAAKRNLNVAELQNKFQREDEIPFSSETKRMSTIHRGERGYFAVSKGAPEIIVESCSYHLTESGVKEISDEDKKRIYETADSFGKEALRLLAIGFKEFDENYDINSLESGLTFLGFFGMIDPPREEVKEAIQKCETAGIKPIMITGDHKVTAIAVAKELGILKEGNALEGSELEDINDEEFENIVDKTEVFARISPSHKMKIVEALMRRGNIVAMTGDGVNDAPSLKKSDIGVAMGIKGTDVSREAADMILTDDNFASIVSAVEEGRSIFENIRKYLVYLLGGNMGTVIGLVFALFWGLPIPLIAVQILFINFIMDGIIAITLSVEPPEPDIMKVKPRNVKEGILNKPALVLITATSLWTAFATIIIYVIVLDKGFDHRHAMTMYFAALIFARLANSFNCRSLMDTSFHLGFFSNKPLILGNLVTIGLTLAVIYAGFLNEPFHTVNLNIENWIIVIAGWLFVIICGEIYKTVQKSILAKSGEVI